MGRYRYGAQFAIERAYPPFSLSFNFPPSPGELWATKGGYLRLVTSQDGASSQQLLWLTFSRFTGNVCRWFCHPLV